MEAIDPQDLIRQLTDARARTCALIDQLSAEQLIGPRLSTTNPLRWEIGHTAYFYEYWVLRQHYKEPALIDDIDKLFDSIHIPHETRWDLDLPSMEETILYMQAVKDRVVAHLSNGKQDAQRDYLVQYAIFHEDMHCEAFTYTRQTLQYPVPSITQQIHSTTPQSLHGDAAIPAGSFKMGAPENTAFVFDNEKWSHEQQVAAFNIARVAVSNQDYVQFVEDQGYTRRELWCDAGWAWRSKAQLTQPVYWQAADNNSGWQIRWFDCWQDLSMDAAVVNINWYEANAYCRWAKRRLPTELEWEVAAAAQPNADGTGLAVEKRVYPWGDNADETSASEQAQSERRATFDGVTLGPSSVHANPQGDSAFGCRQMLGNVWEWTDSMFAPYPDFTPDMYTDYSQPLFGHTRVLRGGCWATRSRLLRNTWRNYYAPERNDVFAGFRTCALN